MVVEDNQVDPSIARQKAQKLVQKDNVDLLFGPVSSAVRVAISPVAAQSQIPLLYTVQYEGSIADDYCNEWLFKTGGIPRQVIKPFVPWLVEEYGSDFYLLGSDYNWPHQTNKVMKPVLEEAGGTTVGEVYVQLGTTDFSSIVPRIQQADPDVLFMTLTGPSAKAIQSAMYSRGVRDQWQDVGLAHGPGSLAGADPKAVEGVVTCHSYAETMQNQANQDFVNSFYEEYGDNTLINYMTGPAYVTIKLLQQAVEAAGDTSPQAIKENLPDTSEEDSAIGFAKFENDHQLTNAAVAKQMNAEKIYEVVKKFNPVAPHENCDAI